MTAQRGGATLKRDRIGERIASLDLSLFDAVPSQTTMADRRSLLCLQRAIREAHGEYVYLEIGSHLGGTIQQHLHDTSCRRVYSIDKRPAYQNDARGGTHPYPDNSTERMLACLRQIASADLSKLVCIESEVRAIEPECISEAPHYCFIDGEHTTDAVLADFAFCWRVAGQESVFCFHDADLVGSAIRRIEQGLRARGLTFQSAKLGGSIHVLSRDPGILAHEALTAERRNAAMYFLLARPRLAFTRYFDRPIRAALRPARRWLRDRVTRLAEKP